MTLNRTTAAVLEAIQALENADIEYMLCTQKPVLINTMILAGVEHKEAAAIVFKVSWRELGFCHQCGGVLEDRRYKECEECRSG